ncbi:MULTISPECIES: tetratricopeptide repeat protein [Haloferax]|uniref:Tetratricopeptide repeat protein n=2 Tax=Haloferax TaxID=2251 RepID=A0A6G1Z039_9EURY|nr:MULTISPECIES: tetratricopeptide repeat protein [Haloferax]KAB1187215.1 tetratricopeptide repeat protein [Haloferax sp. CBA1149]MRW79855.1 tetratricopeptide repeat protein [Haloferax marinisediminis]
MEPNSDHVTDHLELVLDRSDFLRTLDGNTLDKRELADQLTYSRSTVDRAVRDLKTSGLVVGRDGGFTLSLKGRYLLTLFDSLREDFGDVLELDPVLVEEPGDYPLPVDALVGADVQFTTGTSPHRPVDLLGERLATTSHGTFVFARVPSRTLVERLTQWIANGHSCRLITSESVVTAIWREFPVFLETIHDSPDCTVRIGDVSPFSFSYTVGDDGPNLTIVNYDDSGHIQCVVQNTSESGIAWARQHTQSLWKDATEFDLGGHTTIDEEELKETGSADEPNSSGEPALASEATDASETEQTTTAASTESSTSAPATETTGETSVRGDDLPTALQSQGLVRLSPDYFDRVGVSAPLACWRAGFDLAEVRKGYALDRERPTPDGRENVTDDLFERLCDAGDQVVVGPPGAGKSTVCMSVATRWYEQKRGPVVYRKSGQREPFTSSAHLGAYLAEAPGHTLVVVEDATRNEANAIFELVREFTDDDQVTFLLDSRENEWRDGHLRGSARLESHRTQAIDVVSVPPVDARERERIVDHFERAVDREIDIDVDELHPGDGDELAPGEMYLFFHRLARYVEPTAYNNSAPTTLLDDIDGVYEDLRAVDEDLGVDVGVLVNLLNASGIDVDVPLAYALSSNRRDESVVEAALDELERSVLYSTLGDADADRVRTVHETWSTRFLQRLLDVESERRARRRFERCLGALFSLADDEEARRQVQSVFGGAADIVRTIDDDPASWGDRLVKNVFQLGINNPTLSALFAETEYSAVDVPDMCNSDLRLDVRRWRARMFVNGGELDRAKREFEALTDIAGDDFGDEALTRARADGFAGVSEVARYHGEFERARENAEAALDRFEQIDDDVGRSDVLNALGAIEAHTDNPEPAKEYYEQALELRREVGDATKVASTLANLGHVERTLGEYDVAREYGQTSLRIRRGIQYRWGEALSLDLLSHIELEDGSLEDAERYLRLALEIRLDIGDEMGTALSSNNLARIEYERGALDDARERYEDLLNSLDDEKLTEIYGGANLGLSAVLLELGASADAADYAATAVDVFDQMESKRVEARALSARAHLDRGNLDDARSIAEDVLNEAETLDSESQAHANGAYGLVLVADGAVDDGLDYLETAVELAPTKILEGRWLRHLGDVLRTVGRPADALAAFERAVECFSSVEAGVRARETALDALELAKELGDGAANVDIEVQLD